MVSSPAIITEHESGAVRRMMQMVGDPSLTAMRKHKLEINPTHPIMKGLAALRTVQPERAVVIAEQVFDNAMIAAGLMEDARSMLGRLNAILEQSVGAAVASGTDAAAAPTTAKDAAAATKL